MPKRVEPLNAKQFEKWRRHPDPDRVSELVDGAVPGLRVCLTQIGTMTWSLSARINGECRRLNIGEGLGLAKARRKAEEARQQIADGKDPGAAEVAARDRRRAAARGHGTLGSVIAGYYRIWPRQGFAQRRGGTRRNSVRFRPASFPPLARRQAGAATDSRQLMALKIYGSARGGVFPAACSLGSQARTDGQGLRQSRDARAGPGR